ncbi:hypothetical protein D3C87_1588740 [compost metagenome]
MMYKVFGLVFIAIAGTVGYLTLGLDSSTMDLCSNQPQKQTPAEQLIKMINNDFAQLDREHQLPKQWNSIATVEYKVGSDLARALLGKRRPPVQRIQEGTAFLEMEIMDLPDESNPGIIIQASLFDIKSKNKIFEIGRTYLMSDLNEENHDDKSKK